MRNATGEEQFAQARAAFGPGARSIGGSGNRTDGATLGPTGGTGRLGSRWGRRSSGTGLPPGSGSLCLCLERGDAHWTTTFI